MAASFSRSSAVPPIVITWGHHALLSASTPTSLTPTPPPTTRRLRTSPPSPWTAIRRPLQLPIAVHPAPPPPPLPPLRTQAFPSTRGGSGPPYIKTNVGGEEISVRFGGLPALAYGEEATGRPFHWVFGGLISLPTALGVWVLWLRKRWKRRECG